MTNDNRVQISLYMEDLQISYRHPDWSTDGRRLQDSKQFIENFAPKNYFTFFTSITFMLHFTKQSSPPPIEFLFDNNRLQDSETVKHRGLVIDSKLDWNLTYNK